MTPERIAELIPERVVDAALDAWFASEGTPTNGMDAAITAALKEWVASGEARKGAAENRVTWKEEQYWIAYTKVEDGDFEQPFPVIIIRMDEIIKRYRAMLVASQLKKG